ncbi:MAG: hypothetical protein ABI460_08955 [Caldimonas sp.]
MKRLIVADPNGCAGQVVRRAALLVCLALLSACAAPSAYAPSSRGLHACDRNGDQEERKACLP